ncbi:MAG: GmrSD restriction endonuclease domain-containing protein [Methanothrix sp.]
MIGSPLKVEDVISEMSRGGIRLPEIQRKYVWVRSQVAKLLDSIYQGYPTGSILLWDTAQSIVFKDLETGIVPSAKSDFNPKIVLDGQQRITSLARVFDTSTAKQDRILFSVIDEVFEPYSPRNASDPRWIDVTQLLANEVTELDVLDRLIEAVIVDINNKGQRNEIHERLKKLVDIRKYQYPVEIVREDDLEIVTEIFIRVNSGGTRLRESELALARLAWKLPGSIVGPFEEMERLCQERGFDLDTRFLMRALIAVATRQSRFRDLKAFWNRPAREIEMGWRRTDEGIRLTLDFVEGNVGVPGSELLPSHLSLIPLISIFSERDHINAVEVKMLRRWFLIANAFSHYVGASESKLNQDLTALGPNSENIPGLLDQLLKDLRGEPRITAQDLERAGMNSPFFFLSYLAVISQGATDWFKGIKLRRESFTDNQNIEYHHIFPKKLLDTQGVDPYLRDEMANIAFLSQKANRSILAKEPAEYLAEIAESSVDRLEAQFIPMNRGLWQRDRFYDFLVARRAMLAEAMNIVLEA